MIQLGEYMQAKCLACIADMHDDVRKLQDGAQIVISTPSHMYEMVYQRALCVTDIKMLVLCGADETLEGLKDRIYDVFKFLPQRFQVCLSCAVISDEVRDIAKNCMRDPVCVLEKKEERVPVTVRGSALWCF